MEQIVHTCPNCLQIITPVATAMQWVQVIRKPDYSGERVELLSIIGSREEVTSYLSRQTTIESFTFVEKSPGEYLTVSVEELTANHATVGGQ